MPQKRTVAIGVSAIAAALLVFTAFSPRWFTGQVWGQKMRAGLVSLQACDDDKCHSKSWDDAPGAELDSFKTVAKLTFGLSLASALFLLIAAGCLWREKFVFTPMSPASAALILLFGAVIMSIFVMQKNPARGYLGAGSSFMLFMVAAAAGMAGAIIMGRERPNDWLGGENDASLVPEPAEQPWHSHPTPNPDSPEAWPDATGRAPLLDDESES